MCARYSGCKNTVFFVLICNMTDEDFKPYMEQIDELDTNVSQLEEVVTQLDEYTKRLGTLRLGFPVLFTGCPICRG